MQYSLNSVLYAIFLFHSVNIYVSPFVHLLNEIRKFIQMTRMLSKIRTRIQCPCSASCPTESHHLLVQPRAVLPAREPQVTGRHLSFPLCLWCQLSTRPMQLLLPLLLWRVSLRMSQGSSSKLCHAPS